MTLSHTLLFTLTLVAALGSGLIGGIFLAFSNFVMGALARVPAPAGIAAMQSINVVVLNPLFLGIFMGTGLLCLALVVYSCLQWNHGASIWWIAGAALYLLGNIVVTAACNVPRNNTLATLDPTRPASIEAWREYISSWTRWNHIRTVTALAASAAFTMALIHVVLARQAAASLVE